MLQTFTLKNGLKVATYSIPEMKSVFLAQSVKAGHFFDSKETSGVAHFMEHLLVQAIPTLPTVEAFSNFIESLAGSYNATTYSQSIRFNISAPARHLEDLLQISSEVFFEPLFPAEALDKEREAVLEEIRQRQDSLWYKNARFFNDTRFKGMHPLKLDGGGEVETVKKMTRENLIDYWSKFFHPANTYLVLAGGFKNEEAKQKIEQIFEKYPSGEKFPGYPKLSNSDFSRRGVFIRHDQELKTCYVDLTFPSISDSSPLKHKVTMSIIRAIFGGLRSSRLFRLLRQKRGLVYDVSFSTVSYNNFGYSYVSFQAIPEKLEEVIDLIVKELKAFYLNGSIQEELNLVKNYLIDRTLMQFDHPSVISDWIEGDLLWDDKIRLADEYTEIIQSIDENLIKEVMQKYWNFAKLNLTIQGSIKNSKENVQKFEELIKNLN